MTTRSSWNYIQFSLSRL